LEEERPGHAAELTSSGWVRAGARVGHPLTFQLDLVQDEAARLRALTGNWRHNFRRGERRGTVVELWGTDRPLESVHGVYRSMTREKAIAEAVTLGDLYAMRETLGPSFTLGVALGEDGSPCALRGFARLGTRAQDLIAGVSKEGRRRYANYPLLWRLLAFARDQGVRVYDLSGADPERAAGVFNFKKGLGGRMVSLIGEWEWSNSMWLRLGMNLAVRLRGVRL